MKTEEDVHCTGTAVMLLKNIRYFLLNVINLLLLLCYTYLLQATATGTLSI